jgi:hypothetical protein
LERRGIVGERASLDWRRGGGAGREAEGFAEAALAIEF